MEIQDYININKNLYTNFSQYINNHLDDNDDYQNLTSFLSTHDYLTNVEILTEFLRLISNVSNNYTREHNLLNKIYKILCFLKDTLINNFTKLEIFNIFKDNKIVLLFLLTNIIEIDAIIIENLEQLNYIQYFYNIAKPFLDSRKKQNIESYLIQNKAEYFDDFDEKCQKGENDSYLCYLIRNDKIEQFVQYINENSIGLNSIIKPSIFETNPFLIENQNKTTIIEYASFFGSLRIIQYLRSNLIQLTESAWIYAIHSNSAELFAIFEEKCLIQTKNTFFNELIKEAIKCHHNEMAKYIFDQYFDDKNGMIDLYDCIFCYHNFYFFPDDIKNAPCFYAALKNHYNKLVKILMKSVDNDKLGIDYSLSLKIAAGSNNQEMVDIFFTKIGNSIEKNFFKDNRTMVKIIIPPTIERIENSAFEGCSELREVIIPSSVTYIGKYAFYKCSSLNHVIIPPSVTKIDSYAFDECINLTDFQVDFSKTTDFGFYAYNKCRDFKIEYEFINVVLLKTIKKEFKKLENCFEKINAYKINKESCYLWKVIKSIIRNLFNSDVVFLLIDATKKINEQFCDECYSANDLILCMHYFQINSVIIVVDQMESINYSEERFNEIKNEMTSIFIQNGFDSKQFQFVPISENKNENIEDNKSPNFSWWNGLTLNEIICSLKPPQRSYFEEIRVAVTFVIETYFDDSDGYPDTRKIKGIVKSGVVSTPCYLNSAFSKRQADLNYDSKTYAYPGEVKFFEYFYYDSHKLDLLSPQHEKSKCITFTANLIILNLKEELKVGWSPKIHFIHGYLNCKLEKIANGEESKSVKKYEQVEVTFAPCGLIALEAYKDYPNIGIFSIDENSALQAIGIILYVKNE